MSIKNYIHNISLKTISGKTKKNSTKYVQNMIVQENIQSNSKRS